jgi:hypothetical protein
MKTIKIRDVDKSVCTAEQKIAYNLAFRAHISYGDKYNSVPADKMIRNNVIVEIRDAAMRIFRNECVLGKYNEDAIFCCLNAGLGKYLEKPFIATDYETIGKAFPLNY